MWHLHNYFAKWVLPSKIKRWNYLLYQKLVKWSTFWNSVDDMTPLFFSLFLCCIMTHSIYDMYMQGLIGGFANFRVIWTCNFTNFSKKGGTENRHPNSKSGHLLCKKLVKIQASLNTKVYIVFYDPLIQNLPLHSTNREWEP